MMLSNFVSVPYSRPNRFTCERYEGLSAEHKDILSKELSSLSAADFSDIFGNGIAIGSYEEVVYYLPCALELISDNFASGMEFAKGLVRFLSANRNRLEEDRLLSPALFALARSFLAITREFKLTYLSGEQMCHNTTSRPHAYFVANSGAVLEFLRSFVVSSELALFGDVCFESFCLSEGKWTSSAWLLEFTLQSRRGFNHPISQRMDGAISDPRLLNLHFAKVRTESPIYDECGAYWTDLRYEVLREV
jgi:hypothetical protein